MDATDHLHGERIARALPNQLSRRRPARAANEPVGILAELARAFEATALVRRNAYAVGRMRGLYVEPA